jgi:hypothetical protein
MNKYELYAVGHYFSEYPEDMPFKQFMEALRAGDVEDYWECQPYEGIPHEHLACLVEQMAEGLENYFK